MYDLLTFNYEKTWNYFMNFIQPFASEKPYMVLPGNHEAECHAPVCFLNATRLAALSNFSAYNHRFRMVRAAAAPSRQPAAESGATGLNMWYSFNYGNVHFVNIDTETDYPNVRVRAARVCRRRATATCTRRAALATSSRGSRRT